MDVNVCKLGEFYQDTIDLDKMKDEFVSTVRDIYNKDYYFINSCNKFPSKYSYQQFMNDLSLKIFFEENNKIVVGGKLVKYCDKFNIRKIQLEELDIEKPDLVVNNYIIQHETWQKNEW